jgi:transcriptional regulator with XRE-family HTH domain
MTDIRKLLAANMKNCRDILGLSQARLAEKIDTASNYIALIETGKRFPSPQMIERIAIALEVDTPELFSVTTNAKRTVGIVHAQILSDIDQILKTRLNALPELTPEA